MSRRIRSDELDQIFGWDAKAWAQIRMAKKANPAFTLAEFRARRKRNRLARKCRKRANV